MLAIGPPEQAESSHRLLEAPPRRALGQLAHVEATRTGDWWTCVLDDSACIRVVRVNATTGLALVVFTSPLPTRRGKPRRLNDPD